MTILEVRRYLKENPQGRVLDPDGSEYTAKSFFVVPFWSYRMVFSTGWKQKREPRTIWVNEYRDGFNRAYASKDDADSLASAGRIACVKFIEVIE